MTAHILEFQPRDCKSYDFETMPTFLRMWPRIDTMSKVFLLTMKCFWELSDWFFLSTTVAKPERKRHEEIFHCYVSLVKWSPGIIYAVVWNVDRNNGVGNSDIDDH